MEINTLDENKLKLGKVGEELIKDNINRNINVYNKIIENLVVENEGKKAEIDVVLITCVGIFIIESKNWNGYIYGKDKDTVWTQYFDKQNKRSYPNPIKQNMYHIEHISKSLKLAYDYFYSYVVFGDNAILKKITNDTNTKVISNKDLIENIISDIHHNDIKLSFEQIDKIYIDLNYYYEHSNYYDSVNTVFVKEDNTN